jgi:hypothetical protein
MQKDIVGPRLAARANQSVEKVNRAAKSPAGPGFLVSEWDGALFLVVVADRRHEAFEAAQEILLAHAVELYVGIVAAA